MSEEKDMKYYNELALKAGYDERAFSELYEYFFPRVYNFLFARMKNRDAADDVIGAVFLKVFHNISQYDSGRAAFSTWLYRIAMNQMTDYFRQIQRRQEDTWEEFFDPPSPKKDQPESQILAQEGKKELLLAMDHLNERDRNVLELKYWSDMSNKEIAEVLGLSANHVGIILFRAIGALKKIMKE